MKKLSVLPVLLLLAVPAGALTYTGGANQFAGGFSPANAPYGGFGGGACTAVKTPIVFLHGNGDEAKNWDYPSSTGAASPGRGASRSRTSTSSSSPRCASLRSNW